MSWEAMQQLFWAIQYESDRCDVRTIAYSTVLFKEGRMLTFDATAEDALSDRQIIATMLGSRCS
jgi:hypothetical protein